MKSLLILAIGLFFAAPAFADFADYHDQLFRNQRLCDDSLPDLVKAERNFKKMFNTLKKD